MPLLVVVVLLGIVEGLTEFLPVSSTGHLVLAGFVLPPIPHAKTFIVVIQTGAIAAVAWQERRRFAALLRPAEPGRFGGVRGCALLAALTAPALVAGYLLHARIDALEAPIPVAVALAAGGVALLLLERLRGDRGTKTVDALDARTAFGVGLFQCLALWPGVSRSAATIGGAMLLGLSRRAATELSFLAAVPVLVAAAAYKIGHDPAVFAGEAGAHLAVGTVVAGVSALIAVRAFTAFVARHTMEPFAWYRIGLAAVVAAAAFLA